MYVKMYYIIISAIKYYKIRHDWKIKHKIHNNMHFKCNGQINQQQQQKTCFFCMLKMNAFFVSFFFRFQEFHVMCSCVLDVVWGGTTFLIHMNVLKCNRCNLLVWFNNMLCSKKRNFENIAMWKKMSWRPFQ